MGIDCFIKNIPKKISNTNLTPISNTEYAQKNQHDKITETQTKYLDN